MDAIIFDLDNTLYSAQHQVFSLIDKRINRYMQEVVGIAAAEVDGLRRSYWKAYGVTLGGLIRHFDVDPEDYLEYVHDVDIKSRLQPDEILRQSLQSITQRKVVFTNGSHGHACRVLDSLGVADQFEEIFDIRVASYLPKPFPDPYLKVLAALDLPPQRCVMVEDTTANLRTAKELGMGTILVGQGPSQPFVDVQVEQACDVAQVVGSWPAVA